jgi:hypothetical protein
MIVAYVLIALAVSAFVMAVAGIPFPSRGHAPTRPTSFPDVFLSLVAMF